ncbi:hypothetical protein [Nocardia spumae]|uniref:hypothetical protein n=1 Tax=Nocardia spumae TaxID=2887190 RepID=UPI001D13DE97|nr:hypothetical protein [Nocardia spumae]
MRGVGQRGECGYPTVHRGDEYIVEPPGGVFSRVVVGADLGENVTYLRPLLITIGTAIEITAGVGNEPIDVVAGLGCDEIGGEIDADGVGLRAHNVFQLIGSCRDRPCDVGQTPVLSADLLADSLHQLSRVVSAGRTGPPHGQIIEPSLLNLDMAAEVSHQLLIDCRGNGAEGAHIHTALLVVPAGQRVRIAIRRHSPGPRLVSRSEGREEIQTLQAGIQYSVDIGSGGIAVPHAITPCVDPNPVADSSSTRPCTVAATSRAEPVSFTQLAHMNIRELIPANPAAIRSPWVP